MSELVVSFNSVGVFDDDDDVATSHQSIHAVEQVLDVRHVSVHELRRFYITNSLYVSKM